MSGRDRLRRVLPDRIEPLLSGTLFGRFLSVGIVGAFADNATLAVGALVLGLPDLPAKAVGVEVAIIVMFVVNERWTFAGRGAPGLGPLARRFGRSHLVRSGGVSLQIAAYWLLTRRLDVTVVAAGIDVWFLVASVAAIGVAMLVNYAFEGLFTWRLQRGEST
ncbi:GtrA family protein [Halorientalis pallida]|uniref:GtrA family protein n=1 Tax=Halorientalis pallida TaxID=2479928 RepID=A0A498KWJ5_9EURY|nr:GtrA family protein [Halorientalis pallida]RXK46967.1 GtrA family protein [Halorientalis pallida]